MRRSRRVAVVAAAALALLAPAWIPAGLMAAGPIPAAQAAPAGSVDAGVPFSSVVYGTGCTYTLTVQVNSTGLVRFYEQRRGYRPIYLGRAAAYQGSASVHWTPRRQGNRILYAVQNGKSSTPTVARVHQGYGAGGLCFAL